MSVINSTTPSTATSMTTSTATCATASTTIGCAASSTPLSSPAAMPVSEQQHDTTASQAAFANPVDDTERDVWDTDDVRDRNGWKFDVSGEPGKPGEPDADVRRRHYAWDRLQEDRQQTLDALVTLAARWDGVPIQHEMELAAFVSDVWRGLERILGDHLITMWAAVDTVMMEATPADRTPLLERQLRRSAHPTVQQALDEARAAAECEPNAASHDAGDLLHTITQTFLDGLLRVAAGEILDELLLHNPVRIARDPHWLTCPVCGATRKPIPGPSSPVRLRG